MAEDGLDRAIEAIGRMSLRALVPHGARKRVFGDRLPHLSAPARGSLVSSAVHLAFAKNGTPATAAVFSAAPGGGFAEASIALRLKRVVDLTNTRLLRKSGIEWGQLIGTR
jgi:hypothetical protein